MAQPMTITPDIWTDIPVGTVLILTPTQYSARSHNVKLLEHLPKADKYRVKTTQPMGFKVGDTFEREK